MQSEIDKKRESWTKKKLNYIEIHRQKENITEWKAPIMLVEIEKEENEKTIK